MLHVTRDLCTCPGRSLLPLAAWGDTVDTNSEPDTTNKEACAVLRQPGWLMNGLVNAAQPFAGMDLLWESGRRAGQVFLSTAQSAVWVTEGVLDPPCFPGWDSSRLDLSPVKILLAPGVSAGQMWDWGVWPQQSQRALSEGGKGVLLQGSCPSSTPRCLWVCWGWFYDSSSAFGTCSDVGFGK